MRRGGLLRIIVWTLVIGVSAMVLLVVLLRATDDGGEYRSITKKAQTTYKAISGTGNNDNVTEQDEEFVVDPTEAQTVTENPEQGLDVPALTLIPSRLSEDLPVKPLSRPEEAALASAVRNFLNQWETFSPNDSKYRQRLARISPPQGLSRIVSRSDSRQLEGVGPCEECTTGSKFRLDSLDPGVYMMVHGYNGEWAYVSTMGVVELQGATEVPTRWRREYALIITKYGNGWGVVRAIAQTEGLAE